MHERRLFVASCISLVVLAMTFAIRGDIMESLGIEFALDKAQLGWIAGAAFWGFFLAMVFGAPFCDFVGMGRIMLIAFACHVVGVLLTIFAVGFWTLWVATLAIGLGNGLVEAAINPLTATLYPDQKTHKLNVLHAWFPGGIVIGGLAAFALTNGMGLSQDKDYIKQALAEQATGAPIIEAAATQAAATAQPTTAAAEEHLRPSTLLPKDSFGWKVKMAIILLPTLVYGFLFATTKTPPTERVASGVSTGDMFKEAFRPLFLLWMFCMLLTAATELGPNQWIPNILTKTAGVAGILVLVWINGLMGIMRGFAGAVVHRLSPIGLLIGSAVFSMIGLFMLSFANTPVTAFVAATIFAVGVCYFWPTMLGVTSERFPKGGALLLGMMGGAGNVSVALVLPLMGGVYDAHGPDMALRVVTICPAILIFIFGAIYLRDRAAGGYKAVKLGQEPPEGAFEVLQDKDETGGGA